MAKKPIIEWKPRKSRLAQEFSDGLEYAFVSENNKQVHQFVYCKDFLQDALQGFLNQKRVSIYGFVYDPGSCDPICLKKTRLVVTNWRDKRFRERIDGCLDFIHQFESRLHMSKTVIRECDNLPTFYKKSGIWLVEGSKRWMLAPPMISLYTLLLRIGFGHQKGDLFDKTLERIESYILVPYRSEDTNYVRSSMIGIWKIMKYGDRKIFGDEIKKNYPNISTFELHDSCGIVGFSSRYMAECFFPEWYERMN